MKTRAYTLLGFLTWQGAKLWLRQNRSKLGAAAAVAGVLVAGAIAARLTTTDDE
jgi:hypothetical protein